LLKNKPYEGKSEFGVYHLFSVERDGQELAYFATPEISQKIQALGVTAGSEIMLTKVAVLNGKKAKADVLVEVVNNRVRTQAPVGGDSLKQIMEQCLKDSIEITRSLQVPLDIQKIASCLFIART
jgi:Fe2+ transport system protein FeoA